MQNISFRLNHFINGALIMYTDVSNPITKKSNIILRYVTFIKNIASNIMYMINTKGTIYHTKLQNNNNSRAFTIKNNSDILVLKSFIDTNIGLQNFLFDINKSKNCI